jgi:hypothetical protein
LINSFGEVFEANVGDVEADDLPHLSGPAGQSAPLLAMYRKEPVDQHLPVSHGLAAVLRAAVASGSVALDLAVSALGLGAGDEVIMPTFTIISCAAAVVRAGALVQREADAGDQAAAFARQQVETAAVVARDASGAEHILVYAPDGRLRQSIPLQP